jgi:hypothetical protein
VLAGCLERYTAADGKQTTVGSGLCRVVESESEQAAGIRAQTSIFHVWIDAAVVEVIEGVGCSHTHLKVGVFAQPDVLEDGRVKPVGWSIHFRVSGNVAEWSSEHRLCRVHVDDIAHVIVGRPNDETTLPSTGDTK